MAKELQKREQTAPERAEQRDDRPVYMPNVDIIEREDAYVIMADMPGADEKNVEVDLERNVLTIRGRYADEAPEGYELTYREYRGGDYERQFTLGVEIDREGVEASIRDGVLRLVLPKVKEAQPRRIEVKAG